MPEPALIALTILAVFGCAALVVAVAHAVVHRTLADVDVVSPENGKALRERATGLLRALRLLAFGVAAFASISFGLARFGITEPTWDPRALARWFLTHGINLIIIVVGAGIVIRMANLALEHMRYRLSHRHAETDLEWHRRTTTLSVMLRRLATTAVWFVAALMVLRELSVDVMPILTGAGIAGLAIGFGAQSLVRDVISGFFLIIEEQVRIGDIARINTVSGVVEQINLRSLVLRDAEGAVHVFPNGAVTTLANMSKQFAYAVVEVRVLYGENLDRVFGTIKEVGTFMQHDLRWGPVILDPIEIPGVTAIGDGLVTISVKFRTLPLNQGPVANELRRRLVVMLAGRGIKPYGT